jgi:hypothetical protein
VNPVSGEIALSSPECRFPDFICIGAQKAGTTWLDKNLRLHPAVWLPPVKEVHYFDDLYLPGARVWTVDHRRRRGAEVLRRYVQKMPPQDWDARYIATLAAFVEGPLTDDWYGRLFSLAEAAQTCGEITPDYATLPADGIAHAIALSPAVKIIFLMRDPIERAWSHIRMMAHNRNIAGLPQIETFAFDKGALRGACVRSDYPAILASWKSFVPAERIHVDFTDNISSRPAVVLRDMCAFLNLDFKDGLFPHADEAVHVGEPLEIPPAVLAVLKTRLEPVYDALTMLYPEIGAAWRARYY